MAFPITFISETDFFELTNQSINIDPKWIRPSIRPAQDINLMCHLGDDFYAYLITAIETSAETADDLILLSQLNLKYALVFYTLVEMSNTYTDRQENVGSVYNNDSSYTRTDQNVIALKKAEYLSRAQFYLNQFLKWLKEYNKLNPLAFPLYNTFINSIDNCEQSACDIFNDGIYYYKNKINRYRDYYNSRYTRL